MPCREGFDQQRHLPHSSTTLGLMIMSDFGKAIPGSMTLPHLLAGLSGSEISDCCRSRRSRRKLRRKPLLRKHISESAIHIADGLGGGGASLFPGVWDKNSVERLTRRKGKPQTLPSQPPSHLPAYASPALVARAQGGTSP